MVIKKSVFSGYFPDNPQDKFYQSEKFKHLLNYLTQNPSQAERENNQRK
ncbi:MAG: hypothetical protein HG427_002945 [Flavobacteriaceae bacterium]|nr:hypothetical protein [Flavobacteriaceae bacterium]